MLPGDSAGGNLVVAVGYHLAALRKSHKHVRVPKILVPLCSSLQMADLKMPSMRGEHVEKYKRFNYFMYLSFLVQVWHSSNLLPLCIR